jgi:hypothetical protein
MGRFGCVVAVCALAGAAVHAQIGAAGRQGGAPPPPPPPATAVIVGQVVSGNSTDGVTESIVTLTRMGGAPVAGAGGGRQTGPATPFPARRVMTGADGRFVFHSLPPGTYQVSVTRDGYAAQPSMNQSASAAMGLAARFSSGAAQERVTLSEGEIAGDLRLRLWQHGVITGIVLDEAGEPAIGVSVQAARRVMVAGAPRFVPVNPEARADDRGVYRIPSLPPGDYIVMVPQTQVTMPASIMDGLIQAAASGDQAAAIGPLMEIMSSGINPGAALGTGLRLGTLMVASTTGTVPVPGDDGALFAYQTVFYPGITTPGQASVITLAAGEERGGVGFQLRLIRTMRVGGTVLRPDGAPYPNLGVRLLASADPSAPDAPIDVANTVTDAQGKFTFHAVPPGEFVVRALMQPRPGLPGMAAAAMADGPWMPTALFGGSNQEMLFAELPVTLSGADVDNLTMQMREGTRFTGRIEFESVSGREPPAQVNPSLMLTPVDDTGGGPFRNQPEQLVRKDSQVTTRGYPPGRYTVASNLAGWQLKSATLGGVDVLDAPLVVGDRPAGTLVLTFVDRLSTVTGTVTANSEAERTDSSVILFPADHRAWVARGMVARRLHTAAVDRDGGFSMTNVPPGAYLIAAIARSDEGDAQDPAFFERLAPVSTRLTVDTTTPAQALTRLRIRR